MSYTEGAFETNYGTPTNVAFPVPFTTVIPSGAGSTCVDWDSLGGQNYRFPVSAN